MNILCNAKLQPEDAVLIFGDLHAGPIDLSRTVSQQDIRRSAWGLARLGEIFDWPTIALTIPGENSEEPAVISEIASTRSRYRTISRTTPDAFENKEFCRALEETGRKTLVVCGIATEVVVHWLVLSGIANGYGVYLVVDACGGLACRSEEAAFRRLESAGVVMTSVASLAGEVAGDFSRPTGKQVVDVIYNHIRG